MKNSNAGPALWVAGAAVGVAAAWLGKRHFSHIRASHGELGGQENTGDSDAPESAELPIGRSADPAVDGSLSHLTLAIDDVSGAALFGEPEPMPRTRYEEAPLDEIWNSLPGLAEGEQTEGYDAVAPEDMGAVWLERATQTTHDHRPHASDRSDIPNLEDLAVSEASLISSLPIDERRAGADDLDGDGEIDDDDDEIDDDELDLAEPPSWPRSMR